MFCNNTKNLENKNDNNFVNESYLLTQISSIVKTYTTTARETSIYDGILDICDQSTGLVYESSDAI